MTALSLDRALELVDNHGRAARAAHARLSAAQGWLICPRCNCERIERAEDASHGTHTCLTCEHDFTPPDTLERATERMLAGDRGPLNDLIGD